MSSAKSPTSHPTIMSLSRCARGHAGSPIDSLCRVFGIPMRQQASVASGASRWTTQQRSMHVRGSAKPSMPQISLPRKYAFRYAQSRAFSSTRPYLIMKPTGRFKTMEQIKSRANLGVLKISYGQALFRGAFHDHSLTYGTAFDTQSSTFVLVRRRRNGVLLQRGKSEDREAEDR